MTIITPTVLAVVTAVVAVATVAMQIYNATQDTPEEIAQQKHDEAVKGNVLQQETAQESNFTEDTTGIASPVKNSSAASEQIQPVQQQSSVTGEVFDATSAPDQAAQSAAAAPIEVKPVTKPIDVTPAKPVNKADSLSQTVLQTDNPMETTVNAEGLISQAKYDTSDIKNIGSNASLLGNAKTDTGQQNTVNQPLQPTKSAGLLSPVNPNIQQMQDKNKPATPKMVYNAKTNKFEMQIQ